MKAVMKITTKLLEVSGSLVHAEISKTMKIINLADRTVM